MDLGEEQEIRIVFTRWMQLRAGARRHLPQQVEILFSNDGGELFFRHWNVRYIKMKVKAGEGVMSVDEIIVM